MKLRKDKPGHEESIPKGKLGASFSDNYSIFDLIRMNSTTPNMLRAAIQELKFNSIDEECEFYKTLSEELISLNFENSRVNKASSQSLSIQDAKEKVKTIRIEGFENLDDLFDEITEDQPSDIFIFFKILSQYLIQINEYLINENSDFETVLYALTSEMMVELKDFEISQRKYIYKGIATQINYKSSKYEYISSEDWDFVDIKYHEIVEGKGQRIKRGLSFILLEKATNKVIRYGKVKVG